jgi:hypothetical protein
VLVPVTVEGEPQDIVRDVLTLSSVKGSLADGALALLLQPVPDGLDLGRRPFLLVRCGLGRVNGCGNGFIGFLHKSDYFRSSESYSGQFFNRNRERGGGCVRVTLKAMIVGVVIAALVGGTAMGASTLITGKQVKNSSITGVDIKNKSLTPTDFKGSVRGEAGAAGPAGAQGAPGISGLVTVSSAPQSIPPGGTWSPTAQCPAGTTVIGTGFFSSIADQGFVEKFGTLVGAFYFNDTSVTATNTTVQAICAAVSGSAAAARASSSSTDREHFETAIRAAKRQVSRLRG